MAITQGASRIKSVRDGVGRCRALLADRFHLFLPGAESLFFALGLASEGRATGIALLPQRFDALEVCVGKRLSRVHSLEDLRLELLIESGECVLVLRPGPLKLSTRTRMGLMPAAITALSVSLSVLPSAVLGSEQMPRRMVRMCSSSFSSGLKGTVFGIGDSAFRGSAVSTRDEVACAAGADVGDNGSLRVG